MIAGRRAPIAIVAATAIALAAMVLTGMQPDWLLVATLGPLVGSVIWLVAEIGHVAAPAEPAGDPTDHAEKARLDPRVRSLRMNLVALRHDRDHRHDRYSRVYDTLVELTDDQLFAAHGVDRHADPDGARAILGERLYEFVTDPESARSLAVGRNLTHVIDDIERL